MKFLSKKQRSELLQDHRAEFNKKFADRIKAVLLIDDGYTFSHISKVLFIDERTVRRHLRSYESDGLEGLIEDSYKGRVTNLTASSGRRAVPTSTREHLSEYKRYRLLC